MQSIEPCAAAHLRTVGISADEFLPAGIGEDDLALGIGEPQHDRRVLGDDAEIGLLDRTLVVGHLRSRYGFDSASIHNGSFNGTMLAKDHAIERKCSERNIADKPRCYLYSRYRDYASPEWGAERLFRHRLTAPAQPYSQRPKHLGIAAVRQQYRAPCQPFFRLGQVQYRQPRRHKTVAAHFYIDPHTCAWLTAKRTFARDFKGNDGPRHAQPGILGYVVNGKRRNDGIQYQLLP